MPTRAGLSIRVPQTPSSPNAQKAHTILRYAHDVVESLLGTFGGVRQARGARGSATDEEQDLLRAMIVMSCAGLDSMLKQLIREALPTLIDTNDKARAALTTFATKRLVRNDDGDSATVDSKFLAKVLTGASPLEAIIEELVQDLTGGSLQSAEEVFRVANFSGLDPTSLPVSVPRLKEIFAARNRIIHEMDIDFSHVSRNRRTHQRAEAKRMAEDILSVAARFLSHYGEPGVP